MSANPEFWWLRDTLSAVPGLMPPPDVPYWTQQVLTAEECDRLFFEVVAEFDNRMQSSVFRSDGTSYVDRSSRYTQCYVTASLPSAESLGQKLDAAAEACAQSWWGKSVYKAHDAQILGYEERCHFRTHVDNSMPVNGSWERNVAYRDLSGILYLGDCVDTVTAPNQWSGGELVLTNCMTKNGVMKVVPRKGQFVAFPSHPMFEHAVPAITAGYRVAVVNWWAVR